MSILDFFRKKKEPPPVKIATEFGYTTEWARIQAMKNMAKDPEVKMRVLKLLTEQTGSLAKAEIEFQRRYPELQGDE